MSTQYWICVTTDENWKKCMEHRTWGTVDQFRTNARQVKEKDVMIVYLTGFSLAGTCRVSHTYFYSEKVIWKNKLYPHRFNFVPDIILDRPKYIQPFYYKFFTGRPPTGYFRTPLRKIPPEEAQIFINLLDEKYQATQPVRVNKSRKNDEETIADAQKKREYSNFVSAINELRSNNVITAAERRKLDKEWRDNPERHTIILERIERLRNG